MSEPSVKCSAALFVFRVDYPIGTTERLPIWRGNRENKNSQAAERSAAFSF
jgi:hypothetical protein